jgi:hypothetical protein
MAEIGRKKYENEVVKEIAVSVTQLKGLPALS